MKKQADTKIDEQGGLALYLSQIGGQTVAGKMQISLLEKEVLDALKTNGQPIKGSIYLGGKTYIFQLSYENTIVESDEQRCRRSTANDT